MRTQIRFTQDAEAEYRFVHGHRPEGQGRWAFRLNGKPAPVIFINGVYGSNNMIKMLKTKARDLGFLGLVDAAVQS